MNYLPLILIYLLPLAIIFVILRFAYKSMKQHLALKREHNDLLRQIVDKMNNP